MGSLSRPSKILERVSPRPAGTPSLTITAPPGLLFSIINRSPGGRQKCRFRTRRPSKSAGSGAGSGGFRRDAFRENLCFVKGFSHFYAGFRRGFRRVLAGSAGTRPQEVVVSLEASFNL